MKKIIKRILSALLAVILTGLLPMTAFAVNVSGAVYASSLSDNAELILTGDTTLIMDVQKDLKSISGNYALTITGEEWLNVVNSGGHAISVKSLTSSASMYLDSSKDGLNIDGNILITAGNVIVDAGGDGIYTQNGSITIEGGIISAECGSNCVAICAETGNVNVFAGNVTAKGDGKYGIYGNVIILRGTVNSFGLWGIRAEYNLVISGGKTTATGGLPIISMGDITIEGEVKATQTVDRIEGADAIYAEKNIIINSGTVTAETESTNANAIVSKNGNITVNGGFIFAKGVDKAICAENGTVTTKGSINATKGAWGIWAEKDISIDGGFVYATGMACGIWSGGSIAIDGDVNSYSQLGAAILAEQKVTVNHGNIVAVSIDENGIRGDEGIQFKDGRIRAEGGTDAVYTKHGAISITSPLIVVIPKNGTIRSDGKVIVDENGDATQIATISKVHTVLFNANGHGTAPADQHIADGESLPYTPMPAVDGWTFGGWYKDAACKTSFSYTSPITGNLTLYAKWTSDRPILSGTVKIKGTSKHYGDLLELEFSGDLADVPASKLHFEWQESNNKTTWTNIIGETGASCQTPSAGSTVNFYRVRVTADGYDGAVYSDARAVAPASVTDTIKGTVKITQESDNNAVLFIGLPITLSARNSADVEFTMDGMMYRWQRRPDTDSPWEYINNEFGKTYTPSDEDEQYYIRAEVSCRQLLGEIYSSSKWVYWRDIEHFVVFHMNGFGEQIPVQKIERGTYLKAPDEPVAEGWKFLGWYLDEACTVAHDFDKGPVTENFDLYAKWEKELVPGSYTITFDPAGGSVTPETAASGVDGKLPSLPMPTYADRTFNGWFTKRIGGEEITLDTVFTEDTVIYAHWGGGVNGLQTYPYNPFVDVKQGAFYCDAVLWAVNHDPQITKGTDATHFSPNATCTRGQVVTFLWRAAGCPAPLGSKNPFADVAESAFYYKAVLWAVEKGITKGTSETTFSPNAGCTRGQVVTFLHRYESQPEPKLVVIPFTDVPQNAYYYDAVRWAVGAKVTKGTDETHFSPNAICTRGQIVTFLYRDIAELNVLAADDFFLYVKDVYSIPGRGVYATGRVESGKVRKGDTVRLLTYDENNKPLQLITGVSSVDRNHVGVAEASQGDDVELLLYGVKTSMLHTGDAIVGERVPAEPRTTYIGRITLKETGKGGRSESIFSGYTPDVRIGTADVGCTVTGIWYAGLEPGHSANSITVTLDHPATACVGQELNVVENGNIVGVFIVEDVVK